LKIIDAVWEKRNLGVETVEFVIENSDTEVVITEIFEAEKQYNVVKLPTNKPKLMTLLQENGYHFVECMLHVTHDLSENKVAAAKRLRMFESTCQPMNDSDLKELFVELEKGMFITDRIYNDAHFSKEAAEVRYKNWLIDEYEKGSIIYKSIFRGKTIGFFVLKRMKNDVFYPFLAALYNDYIDRGFGISMSVNILSECINQGAKQVSTYISSNNLAIIRVDVLLGYSINGIFYVFVKHKQQDFIKGEINA